jgi:4-diphosphocytidyl-2-C-methyl-D-erythritol kinase
VGEGLRALPVSEPAPAKLNLFLRVGDRRPDGYHEIETLIQPITLADGVRVSERESGFTVVVTGERSSEVPGGPGNLVERAARALADDVGEERGADIVLVKRIPVAAGLGGGSADAAAVLRALDRLWGWGLGPGGMIDIAISIGSDVPALLLGGPVLARGRGEAVEPLPIPKTWWAVVSHDFGISAADAYRWRDEDGTPPGRQPGALVEALLAGDVERAGREIFNDLEASVASRHPRVAETRSRLMASGALGAVMCGSGPTVAGLCRDATHAEAVADAVSAHVVGAITRGVA